MDRREGNRVQSGSILLGSCLQMEIELQLQKFSSRNKRSELHINFSSLGTLHQEDEPPKCSALKASKVCTKIFICFGTQGRSSNLNGTCSDPPTDLGETLRESGVNCSSPWGHGYWWQSYHGAHFTTRTLVLVPFWNPPSTLLVLGPILPLAFYHHYWAISGQTSI